MNDDFDFMLTRLEELYHQEALSTSQVNEVIFIRTSITPLIERIKFSGFLDDLLPINIQLKVPTRQRPEVIDF